jgi:hypothetical protein
MRIASFMRIVAREAGMLRHLAESRTHVIRVLAPDFRDALATMRVAADLARLC